MDNSRVSRLARVIARRIPPRGVASLAAAVLGWIPAEGCESCTADLPELSDRLYAGKTARDRWTGTVGHLLACDACTDLMLALLEALDSQLADCPPPCQRTAPDLAFLRRCDAD